MPAPPEVQDALDQLVADYGTLQVDTGIQTEKYNTLAISQAQAAAADQTVASDHATVATDLMVLQTAIANAFPN